MTRKLIVVDTETTGFGADAVAVEVAWLDTETGEHAVFIPPHTPIDIARAEPKALEVNGYFARLAGRPQDVFYHTTHRLYAKLRGNTLAGSNPAFDARILARLFHDAGYTNTAPWHHRLCCLENLAAGVLGIHPSKLPSLAEVCDRLKIVNHNPHSAWGDVCATAACISSLIEKGGLE